MLGLLHLYFKFHVVSPPVNSCYKYKLYFSSNFHPSQSTESHFCLGIPPYLYTLNKNKYIMYSVSFFFLLNTPKSMDLKFVTVGDVFPTGTHFHSFNDCSLLTPMIISPFFQNAFTVSWVSNRDVTIQTSFLPVTVKYSPAYTFSITLVLIAKSSHQVFVWNWKLCPKISLWS